MYPTIQRTGPVNRNFALIQQTLASLREGVHIGKSKEREIIHSHQINQATRSGLPVRDAVQKVCRFLNPAARRMPNSREIR